MDQESEKKELPTKTFAKNEIVWIIICINNSTHIQQNSRHMPHLRIKHHQTIFAGNIRFSDS